MKKIISPIIIAIAGIVLFAACEKEGMQYNLQNGASPKSLTASSSDVVLTTSNDADTVVSFSWDAASFGEKPAITYTLELDLLSDTTTWANAKTFVAGGNVLSYAFIGKDLNNLLNGMGLPTGVANTLAFRVRCDVTQYNGSASSVQAVYSNTILVNITPYGLSLYIPGAYQGWDPGSAPLLNPAKGRPGMYEAYENILYSGTQYFKYTSAPDWNHINYGDDGNHSGVTADGNGSYGMFSTDGNAGGLFVPDGGYYELTADFNKNTWTATKTTWGIIGDASPGGWNNDTQMSYDATSQVWTATAHMIKNGSFKFRANGQWVIDFGIDNSGNLQYADNPFFGYTSGLNNLSVPEDGDYTITLDLHVSGKYNYSVVKN